jgi:uncharacterized integral membrane protein
MSSDRIDHDQSPQGLDTGTKVKLGLAAIVALVIVVFALSNTDKTQVDYVAGDSDLPLILVIAISFVAGIVVDRLVGFIGRFRRD